MACIPRNLSYRIGPTFALTAALALAAPQATGQVLRIGPGTPTAPKEVVTPDYLRFDSTARLVEQMNEPMRNIGNIGRSSSIRPLNLQRAALDLEQRVIIDPLERSIRDSLVSILKRIQDCPSCINVLNPAAPNVGSAPTFMRPTAEGAPAPSSAPQVGCPFAKRFFYHVGSKCVSAAEAVEIERESIATSSQPNR
jgi:hypothetical protein